MSIGEFFRIKRVLWTEQVRVIRRYYPKSPRFALLDVCLGLSHLFFNPYRVCRKRGEVYGETPLTTLHRMVEALELSSSDTWLELGSGRGRGCLWISQFVGCKTIGLEKISLFTQLPRLLSTLFRLPAAFHCKDFFATDLSRATCVYIYSTCLTDEELSLLAEKLTSLPAGARVLTISAPLPGWASRPLPVSFPWGATEAYIHHSNKSPFIA